MRPWSPRGSAVLPARCCCCWRPPAALARRPPWPSPWPSPPPRRAALSSCRALRRDSDGHGDPRLRELGREIADDYAAIRASYATPRYPIVLAHGLLGFSELSLLPALPPVQYWHGIKQALAAQGCAGVVAASVPPSGSIEDRAAKLAADIAAAAVSPSPAAAPPPVNVIAHSMGGLDARYMIAHLQPPGRVNVASLTTISTPHRGSAFADYLLAEGAGPLYLPRLYGLLERAGLGTRAFAQLTTRYMADDFNPRTPDHPAVRYFSYGAVMDEPSLLSPFRLSHGVIAEAQGPNDGLVSVESSRWGKYEGTLVHVSHLDLINWTNRVRWTLREWMGIKRTFNAIAFYLAITDMLAKEGL